ncbi:hypothetical protein HZC53_01165 [Candidatus Uhrbacteria bacterium]|nr:hypothetical protein [Candidatus Uhrbacteria bacterium]
MENPDIVEVRFFEQDGVVKGRVAKDPLGRSKIVFLRGKQGLWNRRGPLPGERWLCNVIADTMPEDPIHGALLVRSLEPRLLIEIAECGGHLFLDRDVLAKFSVAPELFGLLEDVVEKLRLPTDESMFRDRIDLGRPVGYSPVVPAPLVGYTDSCLFAFRTGFNRPSRIVRARPNQLVSVVSVYARPSPHPSPTPCYFLQDMVIGWLCRPEPWRVDKEGDLERSFGFWSGYAFWFDPRSMDEPFESTWKDVIEGRHRKSSETAPSIPKAPLKLVV